MFSRYRQKNVAMFVVCASLFFCSCCPCGGFSISVFFFVFFFRRELERQVGGGEELCALGDLAAKSFEEIFLKFFRNILTEIGRKTSLSGMTGDAE